jgi:SagB-type dehydrogenase family enzyme
MTRALLITGLALAVLAAACGPDRADEASTTAPPSQADLDVVVLPEPRLHGVMSLEATLAARRSVRAFRPDALDLAELGQLLWAAQGVTVAWGGRTAPSAGATYPIEVYAAVSAVEGIPAGVYRYDPHEHHLERTVGHDVRPALLDASGGQSSVGAAPLNLVVVAVTERTAARYGARAERYVTLEAGHVAQNVALQAVALDLASVPIGAFHDRAVSHAIDRTAPHTPLYILPVGRPEAAVDEP